MNNEKMNGEHPMPSAHGHDMHTHGRHMGSCYWAGWKSPIGLGAFMFLASIAFAVTLYALINLASIIISISHANDSSSMQQYQTSPSTGASSGATLPQ
jgi:hypothetical protein